MGLLSNLRHIITEPEDEWSLYSTGLLETVTAMDGTKLTGWVMRRTINGEHQYRALTSEETADLRYDTYW